MMRKLLIALGVGLLAVIIAYAAIFVWAPSMYVEKAFNILVATFLGSVVVTSLMLIRRRG
jgi:hypothetical protein